VDRARIASKGYEPIQIQNPRKKIFESELWKIETKNWKITFEDK
jgi:hypothetical protein